jgi:hypothetical protein
MGEARGINVYLTGEARGINVYLTGEARGINVYLLGGFKEFCKRSNVKEWINPETFKGNNP